MTPRKKLSVTSKKRFPKNLQGNSENNTSVPLLMKSILRLWPEACLVLFVGLIAFQMDRIKTKIVSRDLHFVPVERLILKHPLPILAMDGNKDGNLYRLLGSGGVGKSWSIEKLTPDNNPIIEIRISIDGFETSNAVDLKCSADGSVFVLQADGHVLIFDENITFQTLLKLNLDQCKKFALDEDNQIYVLAGSSNDMFVFSSEGKSVDRIVGLAKPERIAVSEQGWIYILERQTDSMQMKVFTKSLKQKRSFIVDKLSFIHILRMGVDSQERLYLNDHRKEGVAVYDGITGQYYGNCSRTSGNRYRFMHPGGVSVNKWTDAIYVDFSPGVVQCRFVEETEEEEAGQGNG